jgi:hypothetical protein
LRLSNTVIGLIGFLRLASIVLVLAHWIACLWHMVGKSEDNENWLIKLGIDNETWDIKYVTSVYWVINHI